MKKVTSWKELTLREKIGQTVICLCETDKHIEMCGSIEKFLEKVEDDEDVQSVYTNME